MSDLPNPAQIREALTYEVDLRNDLGIAWKDASNADSCFAIFDQIIVAARFGLAVSEQAQRIGFCKTHKATDVGLHVPEGFCTIAAGRENPENSRGNCVMVEMLLTPANPEGDER